MASETDLQRDDVKAALHVEASPATAWPGPPDGWEYTSSYDACNAAAAPGSPSMVDFYREIAPKLRKTVVFNGDTDPCVSYEGTRDAIYSVGFAEVDGGTTCGFNATAATYQVLWEKDNLFGPDFALRGAGQFGGHVVNFEHNLSFATVHGSGHMVTPGAAAAHDREVGGARAAAAARRRRQAREHERGRARLVPTRGPSARRRRRTWWRAAVESGRVRRA